MGRASNRKWAARRAHVWQLLNSPRTKAEGWRLLKRFIQKPQFFKFFTITREQVVTP